MIVPMKKVVLLALADEQSAALEALRNLGVMQIEPGAKSSPVTVSLQEKLASSEKLLQEITKAAAELAAAPKTTSPAGSGAEILQQAAQLVERRNQLLLDYDATRQKLHRLEPWGNFDRQTIREIEAAGYQVFLCATKQEVYEEAQKLSGFQCQLLAEAKKSCRYLLIGHGTIDLEHFGVTTLDADDDPGKLQSKLADLTAQQQDVLRQLGELGAAAPQIQQQLSDLTSQVEFGQAQDALTAAQEVVYLHGFVPISGIEKLRAQAQKSGWGLLINDPAPDDDVPVLVKQTKFSRIVKPLFDFLGILPGYREMDVSAGVLIFFTIFYAMIIGDAGYGLLFLAAGLVADYKFRAKPLAKTPIRFFILLSIATTIWGALCGNYFGMAHIPGTDRPFPGWSVLSDPATKDANVKAFCFILAVLQLVSGRVWLALFQRQLRPMLEHLGWSLILIGNFVLTLKLIVWPGALPSYLLYLYGIGIALVMLCGINWRDPAAIFQFPFNVIGSFTDILSYIRLFAVGLASSCIAASFNDMGLNIAQVSPWLIGLGVIAILFGHVLNIALGFMSVLVHGVRLNTLEFSNHTGLSWSGQKFKPFTHSKSEESEL